MTVSEHKYWQGLKGVAVSLDYDDEATDDGRVQGVVKGTQRARSFPCNDKVIVEVGGRKWRVYPMQIVRVHSPSPTPAS